MDGTVSKVVPVGLFFLFIFGTGYWLANSGKPYGQLLFNLHKLIALGAGVYLVVQVVNFGKAAPLQGMQVAVLGITGLLFVLTVAAGGLVSVLATGGLAEMPAALKSVVSLAHKILPYLAAASTGALLYLLLRR